MQADPAFPQHPSQFDGKERAWGEPGLSKREWFAGMALGGSMVGSFGSILLSPQDAAAMAGEAYLIADAMIAEGKRDAS